jgi:Putative porin
MLNRIHLIVTTAIVLLFAPQITKAQDAGALLDLLVRKKIITDQEAEEVRADLTKQTAETSAGKWKLSQPITELELYGDVRARYEYRGGETAGNVAQPNDWYQRSRERYRLRLGLRGILTDDWFFGIRLETSNKRNSTNVTFGNDGKSGTPEVPNGPFAKDDDGIYVGQAYIGYKGLPGTTLTVGRMPNPLITTLMVWDGDINPEGVAEQWKHTFDFNLGGGGASAPPTYSKDGKTVASAGAASEPWKLKIDVFANFAQFVYDDANPENPLGARKTADNGNLIPNTDAWLLAWQVGARFTFPKNLYFQVAPVIYNYTGQGDTFNSAFVGGDPILSNSDSLATNQFGIDHLLVLEIPAEFGFKIGELPVRIFSDFAVNFEADARATAAGHPGKGDQRYAYQIGAGIGQLKAKHDWQIQAFWMHNEQYSLDPNLIDSDFFDSRVNMEGVVVQAGYALSDAVIFNLSYGYAQRVDNTLGTGGFHDIPINPMQKYQLFQADLNVRF